MKLYIAGKMQGLPLYNFPAFFKAALALREQGINVINPAEKDMARGFDPGKPLKDQDFSLEETLRQDFLDILHEDTDGVVFLPGWQDSSGARDEYRIARRSGKHVYWWNPERNELVTPGSPPESKVVLS